MLVMPSSCEPDYRLSTIDYRLPTLYSTHKLKPWSLRDFSQLPTCWPPLSIGSSTQGHFLLADRYGTYSINEGAYLPWKSL